MQDYKRALYDFSAAIRFETRRGPTNSNLAKYYMFAGQANQLLGQYEEALAHFDIAAKKSDSDANIFYNRGLTYASLQRFEEARRDFANAVEKQSSDPMEQYKYLFNLGVTLRRLGKPEDSCEILKVACDKQPNSAAAQNNWGLSLFESQQYDEARQSYSKAIQHEQTYLSENPSASRSNLSFYLNNRGLSYYHVV